MSHNSRHLQHPEIFLMADPELESLLYMYIAMLHSVDGITRVFINLGKEYCLDRIISIQKRIEEKRVGAVPCIHSSHRMSGTSN